MLHKQSSITGKGQYTYIDITFAEMKLCFSQEKILNFQRSWLIRQVAFENNNEMGSCNASNSIGPWWTDQMKITLLAPTKWFTDDTNYFKAAHVDIIFSPEHLLKHHGGKVVFCLCKPDPQLSLGHLLEKIC